MSEQYKCHKCQKLIAENEGVTTIEGLWVCDQDTCRTLDGENEAHVVVSDKLQEIKDTFSAVFDSECVADRWMKWLIEQLEQAQQENERLKEIDQQGIKCQMEYARQNKLLVEQNQKLVECLEWYADTWNYQQKPYTTEEGYRMFQSEIDKDCNGKRARTVLQEVQHGTSTRV